MERLDDLLRTARHAPAPTAAGLDDVTRRGRRRRRRANVLTAGGTCVLVAVAIVGTSLAATRDRDVVAPGVTAAPPPSPEPSYRVIPTQIRWHAAHLAPDGRTLTVTFTDGNPDPRGNCFVRMRARAEETAESVTIRLETLVAPGEGGGRRVCLMRAYARSESVTLGTPLGDRRVIDWVDGGVRAVIR
jgi:hypothetical protein